MGGRDTMISEESRIPYRSTDLTGGRVLVLSPHPDDETFGCGGTLVLHTRANDPVKIVFLTSGDKGDANGKTDRSSYAAVREAEAKTAARCLGIEDLEFWRYGDRTLSDVPDAAARMVKLFEDYEPNLVYVPSPLEIHPDHIATAAHFFAAVQRGESMFQAAFYEVGQPLRVNCLVDITPVLKHKIQASNAYVSQLREIPYTDVSLALNRFRGVTLSPSATHAEGFSVWSTAILKTTNSHEFSSLIFKH